MDQCPCWPEMNGSDMLVCSLVVLRMVTLHLNQFVTLRVQVELDVVLRVFDILAESLQLVAGARLLMTRHNIIKLIRCERSYMTNEVPILFCIPP